MPPSHPHGPTAGSLARACRQGQLDIVRADLDARPELISSRNPYPWHRAYGGQLYRKAQVVHPIEVAAYYGRADVVRELLRRSTAMNPGASLRGLQGAVGVAEKECQPDVLEAILEHVAAQLDGSPDELRDGSGWELLYEAAAHPCLPLIELLLERGVHPTRDVDGWQPIHHAVWYGWPLGGHPWMDANREAVELLLAHGARETLWIAAGIGDLARAQRIIERDPASIHGFERDQQRAIRSPIGIAAWHGHSEVVELLLAHGARPDPERPPGLARHEFGSPTLFAAANGHHRLAERLLEEGAELLGELDSAANVVEQCYQSGDTRLAKIVLDAGGQPSIFSHVRAKNLEAIGALLAGDPDEPYDSWPASNTVLTNILSSAAWLGNATVVEMALSAHPGKLTADCAVADLRRAIVSHNRDGSYGDYRRVIVQLLDHLDSLAREGRDARDVGQLLGSIIEYVVREYHQPTFGSLAEVEEAAELVELLLERGALMDAVDPGTAKTALTTAVELGYERLVATLLAHGAVPGAGAHGRPSDMAIAEELGLIEIAGRLSEVQVDGMQDSDRGASSENA